MPKQSDYLQSFKQLLLPTISKFQRLMDIALAEQLAQLELSLSEFRIVGLLMGEASGHSQKLLAKKLGISPPSLSVAIGQLEKKHWVERITDPRDQRIKKIQLAKQLDFKAIAALINAVETQATANISEVDLQTTKRVLNQLLSNISPSNHCGEQ